MEEIENSENQQIVPVENNHVENQTSESARTTDENKSIARDNFRRLENSKKELERELRLARETNEKLLAMATQANYKPPEVDELDTISDDDYLNKGKTKKAVRKELDPLHKKIEQLEAQLNQQKQTQFINDLKRKYSDFDEIVNPETLALLEENEPELAQTIVDLKDPYKMGISSYKYIKALNIADKIPKSRREKEVDKKLEQNAKSVPSPQNFEKRPMAQAFRMSDQEKRNLYEEMTRCAGQVGFGY